MGTGSAPILRQKAPTQLGQRGRGNSNCWTTGCDPAAETCSRFQNIG
jgi:hypothetical protein